MKAFLKDNIALVAAVVLPLLLAVIFGISTLFANATVEDPKNDFLLATDYDAYSSGFQFTNVNDKLVVSYKAAQKDAQGNDMPYMGHPRFWRVHVPEMTIEEISLKNPNGTGATAAIDIPGITDVTVRNITPGPDGYTFTNSYHGYHTNLMTEIFSGSYDYSDRYSMALFKNGRYVPVNVPDNNPYNNYNTQFIGWIIE